MLISSVVAVTPSRILISSAVALTAIVPILSVVASTVVASTVPATVSKLLDKVNKSWSAE